MNHTQSNLAADTVGTLKSAVKKYEFPYRMGADDLGGAYASLEAAFAAHDFIYVARFGRDNPELHGCALLMLGNRVGGERILDQNSIHTTRACFYRAYAAWQENDVDKAKSWITEGRATGADIKFDRFEVLINQQSFRVLFYYDYHNQGSVGAFSGIPGIEMVMVPHLCGEEPYAMDIDQPIGTIIPKDKPLDLVLIDDFKLAPVGLGDLDAPVVVWAHDHEWYYEYFDQILPEVDLIIIGATSEAIEIGRALGIDSSFYFYPVHLNVPEDIKVSDAFKNAENRTTDIFYSGSIGYNFYIYKKQQVLRLAELDKKFNVEIFEGYLPLDELWKKMRTSRFSIMSARACNYVSSRAVEAVTNGVIYLAEEDEATAYMFSEPFSCFPTYRRDNILAGVEEHLNNYDKICKKFRHQAPQFEKEFNSLLPCDKKVRAQRFLRHLLFMTYVEKDAKAEKKRKPKSSRSMAYINEYNHFIDRPASAESYVRQTVPPHWLRRAFAVKDLAMALKKPDNEMFGDFRCALLEGIAAQPDSMALYLMLGLCDWYLDKDAEAEQAFAKVTSGQLRLLPDDPMPIDLGRLVSFYWVNDARIRERCYPHSPTSVPAENVVKSYAWAYRAYIERRKGAGDSAYDAIVNSLELFPYNDEAQRLYLRIVFDFIAAGQKEWCNCFLEAFDAASHNDRTIMHDFAAPAFHVLMTQGREDEGNVLLGELRLYLSRVKLFLWHHALYQEFYPYNQHYGIPHANATKV